MRRCAAVAGQFYQGDAPTLRRQVEQYVVSGQPQARIIAALCPHAGLVYSGHVAGAVYSAMTPPETFILLGPNHTGIGAEVSMMGSGDWEIPTACISIDEALAKSILEKVPLVEEDEQAHRFEHSIEVQLPFIVHFSGSARIVPITVMKASLDDCLVIGEGIAEAVREAPYDVAIVASSDMSHYVPDSVAKKLDHLAIKELLDLNPEGLYTTVRRERISMCGYLPATIMLYAARALGAKQGRLIKYATSAEVSGDYDHVVGYAGIIFT